MRRSLLLAVVLGRAWHAAASLRDACRIKRAKALLLKTKKPLGELALECGFSSQSHLTTVFRRFVDVTPARFRA